MKIRIKTLLMVSLLVVVVITGVSVSFVVYYTKGIQKDNVIYSERILQNAESLLDDYFDDLGVISSDVNYNYYLQNYLINAIENETGYSDAESEDSVENYIVSTQVFGDVINDRNDVSSIRIFGRKTLLLEKTSYSYQYLFTDFASEEWYESALESDNSMVVTGLNRHTFLLGNTDETISVSKKISSYVDGSFLGILLIDLNLNGISEIIEQIYIENQGVLCVTNSYGELIYIQENNEFDVSELESLIQDANLVEDTGSLYLTSGGTKYQMVYNELERAEWNLIVLTPTDILQDEVNDMLFMIIMISLFVCVLVILLINIIMSKIVKPLETLKEQMDNVDKGNLSVVEVVKSGDEIEELSSSFNSMLIRVQKLESDIIKEQEEKRKYEFQALQEQINPHFLYNTLDTIIWMAETKDTRIVSVTEALARLFRISLNRGSEYLRVQDEIEHVKNYLIIQEIRYKNKMTYTINVEPEVLNLKMIKLLIQPIVENSIYHGIKQKRGSGNITINAFRKENVLFIEVIDDGVGMTDEQIHDLMSGNIHRQMKKKGGIGVKNVNQRIRVSCGDEYGIICVSEVGVGTTMVITLPIIEDELLWKKED